MRHPLLALLLSLPLLLAQTAPSTSPALPSLLHDLGSEDFATRSAAQRQLDALPASQLPALQSAADAATDPEVKARLLARIDALDGDLALHPPPISLELKNAAPQEVADQLTKAAGIRFTRGGLASRDVTFSLSAKNLPLMEVLHQLALQSPITYGSSSGSVSLNFYPPGRGSGPNRILPPIANGPLLIYPARAQQVGRGNVAAIQNLGITYTFTCLADPRMMVYGQSFTITSASDDHNNPLAIDQADGTPFASTGPRPDELARINRTLWNVSVAPPRPPTPPAPSPSKANPSSTSSPNPPPPPSPIPPNT